MSSVEVHSRSCALIPKIDSHSVIQLLLQYLKETGLNESYQTLAKETRLSLPKTVITRVSTNIVSNKELLISSILNGKWDYVLEQVSAENLCVA